MKCHLAGIPVPAIYFVDERAGRIYMSLVENSTTVRDALFAANAGWPHFIVFFRLMYFTESSFELMLTSFGESLVCSYAIALHRAAVLQLTWFCSRVRRNSTIAILSTAI